MARRRNYAPIRRVRRYLLLGLALGLAAVALLYLRHDAGGGSEPPPASRRVFGSGDGAEVVLASQGFIYEKTEGETRTFRLEADRIASNSDGLMVLEKVHVRIDRGEQGVFEASSQQAEYTYDSKTASLTGNVLVSRGDGLELRTDGLVMVENGAALESTTAVRFAMGDAYRGRAASLYYDLERNHLTLTGNVELETLGGGSQHARLTCRELIVDRNERLVRAEGDVRLERGASWLTTRRLSLAFAADEKTLEHAQAFFDVDGELTSDAGNDLGSTLRLRGYKLAVTLVAGAFEKFELEGIREAVAIAGRIDGSGLEQEIRAPYLTGEFLGGELSIVRAFDGVDIRESLPFAATTLRRACAQWALASFDPQGEIEEMVLQNEVDYQEGAVQAVGDRIRSRALGDGGEVTLTGQPARLRAEGGTVQAPRISYTAATSSVEAVDGVSVVLPPRGGVSLVSESSDEPIRVTSTTASWSAEPSRFTFEGSVRAWQAEDYLLTDKLVGEQDGDLLTATGRVKGVVRPKADPAAAGEAKAEARPPVEITAQNMRYERPTRLLQYIGGVRLYESGKTLRCDALDTLLGEKDKFERLTCTGQTVLENPATGHTVRGNEAIYAPDEGTVRITGAPAVLQNKDGAQLRGPLVIYDMESGTAQVQSGTKAITTPAEVPPSAAAESGGGGS
jgi:lipopolysaccharide transport protein LptA